MVAVELAPAGCAVDWSAPWFRAVAADAVLFVTHADRRAALSTAAAQRGVCNAAGQTIRFGAADAAGATAYEAHIARTGEVPTRDNRHDLFNALVWLAFPRTKARLNALQASVIAARGVHAGRGPLRDAATLLDENGVLLVTHRPDLLDALRRRDWRELFIRNRSAWHGAIRPVVFGHALMDKLVAPYKAITAHALPVPLPAGAAGANIDAVAAAALDEALTTRALLPLPVLGIPEWADNRDQRYYDDPSVFRPARARG